MRKSFGYTILTGHVSKSEYDLLDRNATFRLRSLEREIRGSIHHVKQKAGFFMLNQNIYTCVLGCFVVLCITPRVHSDDNRNGRVPQKIEWQAALSLPKDGKTVVRDSSGRLQGTITRSGDSITFRDSSGRVTGTADASRNQATFRDASGRSVGSATTNREQTTFRSSSGRIIGTANQSASRTTFRDSSGRTTGSATNSGSRTTVRDGSGRQKGSIGR